MDEFMKLAVNLNDDQTISIGKGDLAMIQDGLLHQRSDHCILLDNTDYKLSQ